MKKYVLISFLLLLPLVGKADLLVDLLDGKYNAETLSADEMDSILNRSNPLYVAAQEQEGVSTRYQLQYENRKQIYRRSFEADYFVYDTQKKQRFALGNGPVRDPQMSPNGRYVVYTRQDTMFIYKLDFKTEVKIGYGGSADWLYEEEFGITRLFWWSPDSRQVAFVRLKGNQSVTPLFGGTSTTVDEVAYVRAGEANPTATACVYDLFYKSIKEMQLPELADAYIPRMRWNGERLLVQRLNRDQNEMTVYSCNPKSTTSSVLYSEKQKNYYVDYEQFDSWCWLKDGRFLVMSEKDAYRRIYLYGPMGQEQKCLTPQDRDVTKVYGYDERAGIVYYQAAPTPETRHVYALNLRKMITTQLTTEEGIHDATFSADRKQYIDCYQSVTTPNKYTLYTAAGKVVRELKNNNQLQQDWEALDLPEMEFGSFVSENGDTLHYWTLTPKMENSPLWRDGRMPVVMTQYSGPASQRVLNRWRKRWDYYLASIGYKVVCCDPRGTDARGKQWRAETYMELGRKEAQDQLSFARFIAQDSQVDANRIAMIGWSYGGFQVLRTLAEQGKRMERINEAALIRSGVAIAPVTDWRLYDSAYTERYMRRPQVNEGGYRASDLKSMAGNITGNLLIVHGMADDNVHVQHTMQMVEALVDAGKQFDMQIYPDDNHFLKKGNHYEHLHRRLLRFLDETMNNN